MNQFTIQENRWYAWMMLLGYIGVHFVPYCSPIYVKNIQPLKTGRGLFGIDFVNVLYAQGDQEFSIKLRVLKRAKEYLVGELSYSPSEDSERVAIISQIEMQWIERFCPELWRHRPPSSLSNDADSVNMYLNEVFLN